MESSRTPSALKEQVLRPNLRLCSRRRRRKIFQHEQRTEAKDLFFIFFSWGETESTWYCGHCFGLLYQPPMIDDDDDDWQEKPKYPEKTCPSATNPT
jgi:hypothetical protein